MELTDQELDQIVESGREMAHQWFVAALNTKQTPDQVTRAIRVLNVASINTLATIAMNLLMENKRDRKELCDGLFHDLNAELDLLLSLPVENQETHPITQMPPAKGVH